MHSQIFVNLPVKDLKRSVDFFTKLGYTFNPQFTDENATCMILGDNLFVMLLVEKFFSTFTNKAITDTSKSTEVLTCVACRQPRAGRRAGRQGARRRRARCRASRRTTASCTPMATRTSTATPGNSST